MEAYGDVDHALSYFEFDNGAAGDAEASRNSPYGYDIRAEIIGSEGSLFIGELRDKSLTILNATGSRYEIIPDFQTRFHDAYRLELQHFIDCVRSRNTPIVTAEDATTNLKVALAATESMKNGKKVVLQPQASL
jgi:scyllo-inositol 2-dehydrogenase (NAD+)